MALASKWCANAKMFDLLPLLWSRSSASFLRCRICCCFGLEVVPHFQDVRFVAVAEVCKWCPFCKMYKLLPFMLRCTIWISLLWSSDLRYDLLPLLVPKSKMQDLLPLLWSRNGAPNRSFENGGIVETKATVTNRTS